MSVAYSVRQRAATADGDRAIERWRVPKELLEIEFPRADLVCEKDTPWRQWVGFALNSLGLEFLEHSSTLIHTNRNCLSFDNRGDVL